MVLGRLTHYGVDFVMLSDVLAGDYIRLNVCQATRDLQTHLVIPRKPVPNDHVFQDGDRRGIQTIVQRGAIARPLNFRKLVVAGGNMQLENGLGVVVQA